MKKQIRSQVALAVVVALSGAMGFAQDGAATYKANCQGCHGTTGTPPPGMAKMLDVKPASQYTDSVKDQEAAVKNGKNKMKPFGGKLTDDQIKDVVAYFRTLK